MPCKIICPKCGGERITKEYKKEWNKLWCKCWECTYKFFTKPNDYEGDGACPIR